ncbi:MAG: hypothetical protein JJT75_10655 [Opitutales bacterium]|nr:hypothetical protein [Opitutales bacterium]MCH8540866.1 hypothetical protein [Opitutales bacterium]
MSISRAVTILIGLVLILILAPLSQFMTMMTVNADIETATPVGWAIGILFTLLLAWAFIRSMAKVQAIPRQNLVILFVMLSIAAPVMNLGLVRTFYNANSAALDEYFFQGNPTYRTIFDSMSDSWFPKVPTDEGLAWNRADRFLRFLTDNDIIRDSDQARRSLVGTLETIEAEQVRRQRLEDLEELPPVETIPEETLAELVEMGPLRERIPNLLADDAQRLLDDDSAEIFQHLGLADAIEAQQEQREAKSAEFAPKLISELSQYDEFLLTMVEDYQFTMDPAMVLRVNDELNRLSDEEREARLRIAEEELAPRWEEWQAQVSVLTEVDSREVRNGLMEAYLEQQAELSRAERDDMLSSFAFRLSRSERRNMIRQDGSDAPNQNIYAFRNGLWDDSSSRQLRDQQSFWANMSSARERIPWELWIKPIFNWGLLFLAIFLFMMCLAEYFRRKWVERENLAFPLVEIADGLIRHDYKLETADDIREPEKRSVLFDRFFLFGVFLGFLILSLEAINHYGLVGNDMRIVFDASGTLFTSGILSEIDKVVFVFSPIVIGIAFLISLELSFSIWMIFFIYTLFSWIMRLMADGAFNTGLYTGWAGGSNYPYPMEQLLGAVVCFTLFLLIKSWKTKSRPKAGEAPDHYVPPRLTMAGLIVLPIFIFIMIWNIGVNSPFVILLFGLLVIAIAIAAARVRAETGLPTQHVTYDFTKMPMIFGLTSGMGAKNYAAFLNIVFLPWTLIFRSLPQQLENIELARRYKLRYGVVAVASLLAFVVAIGAGFFSFLMLSHYFGDGIQGNALRDGAATIPNVNMAKYPLWVGHFQGEGSLEMHNTFSGVHVFFVAVGFVVILALTLLRKYFLSFPLHPIGYLVLLFSLYYHWISPYHKGEGFTNEASLVWGGVLVAWGFKKLIIKYGGMNSYKAAKPFFIGLVIGSIFCVFCWNMLDLLAMLMDQSGSDANFIEPFQNHQLFSPRFY